MDVSFNNVVESTRQYFQGIPTPGAGGGGGGGGGQQSNSNNGPGYGATPFWSPSYQQQHQQPSQQHQQSSQQHQQAAQQQQQQQHHQQPSSQQQQQPSSQQQQQYSSEHHIQQQQSNSRVPSSSATPFSTIQYSRGSGGGTGLLPAMNSLKSGGGGFDGGASVPPRYPSPANAFASYYHQQQHQQNNSSNKEQQQQQQSHHLQQQQPVIQKQHSMQNNLHQLQNHYQQGHVQQNNIQQVPSGSQNMHHQINNHSSLMSNHLQQRMASTPKSSSASSHHMNNYNLQSHSQLVQMQQKHKQAQNMLQNHQAMQNVQSYGQNQYHKQSQEQSNLAMSKYEAHHQSLQNLHHNQQQSSQNHLPVINHMPSNSQQGQVHHNYQSQAQGLSRVSPHHQQNLSRMSPLVGNHHQQQMSPGPVSVLQSPSGGGGHHHVLPPRQSPHHQLASPRGPSPRRLSQASPHHQPSPAAVGRLQSPSPHLQNHQQPQLHQMMSRQSPLTPNQHRQQSPAPHMNSNLGSLLPSAQAGSQQNLFTAPTPVSGGSRTLLQPAATIPSSSQPPRSGGPIKRESPLDLSVKTIRQSADSTADQEHIYYTFHNEFMRGKAASRGGTTTPSHQNPPAHSRVHLSGTSAPKMDLQFPSAGSSTSTPPSSSKSKEPCYPLPSMNSFSKTYDKFFQQQQIQQQYAGSSNLQTSRSSADHTKFPPNFLKRPSDPVEKQQLAATKMARIDTWKQTIDQQIEKRFNSYLSQKAVNGGGGDERPTLLPNPFANSEMKQNGADKRVLSILRNSLETREARNLQVQQQQQQQQQQQLQMQQLQMQKVQQHSSASQQQKYEPRYPATPIRQNLPPFGAIQAADRSGPVSSRLHFPRAVDSMSLEQHGHHQGHVGSSHPHRKLLNDVVDITDDDSPPPGGGGPQQQVSSMFVGSQQHQTSLSGHHHQLPPLPSQLTPGSAAAAAASKGELDGLAAFLAARIRTKAELKQQVVAPKEGDCKAPTPTPGSSGGEQSSPRATPSYPAASFDKDLVRSISNHEGTSIISHGNKTLAWGLTSSHRANKESNIFSPRKRAGGGGGGGVTTSTCQLPPSSLRRLQTSSTVDGDESDRRGVLHHHHHHHQVVVGGSSSSQPSVFDFRDSEDSGEGAADLPLRRGGGAVGSGGGPLPHPQAAALPPPPLPTPPPRRQELTPEEEEEHKKWIQLCEEFLLQLKDCDKRGMRKKMRVKLEDALTIKQELFDFEEDFVKNGEDNREEKTPKSRTVLKEALSAGRKPRQPKKPPGPRKRKLKNTGWQEEIWQFKRSLQMPGLTARPTDWPKPPGSLPDLERLRNPPPQEPQSEPDEDKKSVTHALGEEKSFLDRLMERYSERRKKSKKLKSLEPRTSSQLISTPKSEERDLKKQTIVGYRDDLPAEGDLPPDIKPKPSSLRMKPQDTLDAERPASAPPPGAVKRQPRRNNNSSKKSKIVKKRTKNLISKKGVKPKLVPEKKFKSFRRKMKGSSGFDYIRKKKKPSVRKDGDAPPREKKKPKTVPMTEEEIQAEIKVWVLNKGIGETLLHRAAKVGNVEVVHYCLEKLHHNPAPRDNAGYTPLHVASTRGYCNVASLLLKYGASVNDSALGGVRPLHEAAENGFTKMVKLLLDHGADPQLATYSGQTALGLAIDEEARHLMELHIASRPPPEQQPQIKTEVEEEPSGSLSGVSGQLPTTEDESSDIDGIEVEESTSPLPSLYRLAGEPRSDSWILFHELSPLLKVKTREALLKQLGQEARVVLRDMKISEFYEKAHCRAIHSPAAPKTPKVTLVKYTDTVRFLLGVETTIIPR